MNEQEKAREYAKKYKACPTESIYQTAYTAFIAGSKSGYSAGVKSGVKIGAIEDAEHSLLAKTFEELLKDRIQIKELRDFWRNRAGLPIPEEDDQES